MLGSPHQLRSGRKASRSHRMHVLPQQPVRRADQEAGPSSHRAKVHSPSIHPSFPPPHSPALPLTSSPDTKPDSKTPPPTTAKPAAPKPASSTRTARPHATPSTMATPTASSPNPTTPPPPAASSPATSAPSPPAPPATVPRTPPKPAPPTSTASVSSARRRRWRGKSTIAPSRLVRAALATLSSCAAAGSSPARRVGTGFASGV